MMRPSAICLALELLIAATTLAPNPPVLPQTTPFLLFPFIFGVHFSSILRLTPRDGRARWHTLWRPQLAGVPPLLLVAFAPLFAGAWLVVATSIATIGGQPTMIDGHYHLNDHGAYTMVTRAAYEHTIILEQRIFTLLPSVFFALGVLAHYPRQGAVTETIAPRG